MAYKSKYTGAEVDALLDKIAEDNVGDIDSALSTESENPVMNKVVTAELSALQTEVDSHDVAIEDLQDNKVDKGDYAPALTAGFADNLVSKDVVVDSEFNLRRSGGGAISDGVARMEVVKGNSVVWNQLGPNADFREGAKGWAVVGNNGTLEVTDGVANITLTTEPAAYYWGYLSRKYAKTIVGHKYAMVIECKIPKATQIVLESSVFTPRIYISESQPINTWVRVGAISTCNQETNNGFVGFFHAINGGYTIGDSWQVRALPMYDLTQMFGAGNEPTTIDEFYARKPIVEDEYAYNEGEVIHCNVDAVKSVGRNVWDEEWELGAYNSSNGKKHATTSKIRNVNPISVLPNQKYYIASPISHVYFYDVDYQYIKNTYTGGIGTELQIPVNAAFLNFETIQNVVTYNHDICINLSDPDFNGQYEPYKEDVRELLSAIKEVFPNGMMSAGTAHDVAYNDLNKEVGVTEKRIGVVDMGVLNWQYALSGSTIDLMYVDMSEVKMGGSVNCARFAASPATENWSMLADGSICVHATRQRVIVKNPGYTDATAFKAAMAGVMLYYELAEPIVTEHQEPFNLDYQVTNGGQEQAMATEPTSAFKADIAYGFNASAKIKENANEIASLKATIAQLQAALASMVNENVEEVE